MAEIRYVSREEYDVEVADLRRRRSEYEAKWNSLRRIVANIRRWEGIIAGLEARYGELRRRGWARLTGPERTVYLQIRDTRLPRARAYWVGWDTERTSIITEIKREREEIRAVEAAIANKIVVVTYTLTITVNNPEWGTTTPAPGSYDYTEGTTATVTALPKEGYVLDYWQLDGIEYVPHPGDTVKILMDKDHTLTTWFKKVVEELIADEECLVPSTLIFTKRGLLPISNVKVKDETVHGGVVNLVLKRHINETIYYLKPYYFSEIGLTRNQPVWVVEKNYLLKSYWDKVRKRHCAKYLGMRLSEPKWLTIKECKSQQRLNRIKFYVGFPCDDSEEDIEELNESRCQLLGYYAAEGNLAIGRQVMFTLDDEEIDIANSIQALAKTEFQANSENKVKTDKRNGNKYRLVRVYSAEMVKFIQRFCIGTAKGCDKQFTAPILFLPKRKQMIITDCAWKGDGTLKMTGQYRYGSSSKMLILQLQWLLLRNTIISGISTSIGNSGFSVGNPFYELSYTRKSHLGFIKNNCLFVPVKSISKQPYEGDVYSLKIKPLESYLTQGGLVHNCTGYDIFYDVERKKYVVRDPKTKQKIREENKICMELTASIETSEGHDVPVVVEITCTTYVKQMSLSELVKAEKTVEEGLRNWLIEQGWEQLMRAFEKVGVAYNGEEHVKKAGRYTWLVHDYPRVNVLVEKKKPRARTYKGEFTVE